MLSKSQISFVKSLHQKKFRKEHALFIVEGIKSVTEFLQSDYIVDTVYCTENLLPKLGNLSQKIQPQLISTSDLDRISTLTTPQQILALVKMPVNSPFNLQNLHANFSLVLDGVQDPGNLGTIIRTADWFGIKNIICSEDTVEIYNPKVVQASMGSLPRITISYTNLAELLKDCPVPVYGALLDGESIYQTNFGKEGIVVLGNEGNGISAEIRRLINKPVTIPSFGKAESLNVAISASIFCSEIKRNFLK
jgi:RNA methyltransferase, TrmH family